MIKFKILVFVLLSVIVVGCESEAQRRSTQSFEKILSEKKKFQKMQQDDPSIHDQLTREIHSQSESSQKKGTFKFGRQ